MRLSPRSRISAARRLAMRIPTVAKEVPCIKVFAIHMLSLEKVRPARRFEPNHDKEHKTAAMNASRPPRYHAMKLMGA